MKPWLNRRQFPRRTALAGGGLTTLPAPSLLHGADSPEALDLWHRHYQPPWEPRV